MRNKNTIITVIVLLVAAGFIFYRQALTELVTRDAETVQVAEEQANLRELQDTVTYEVPGGTHTIKFSIFVDDAGNIQNFTALDTTDPDHQQQVNEFYMTLGPKIKGKKLSELEAIDKVGTSSLTTGAFNIALANIKTQL